MEECDIFRGRGVKTYSDPVIGMVAVIMAVVLNSRWANVWLLVSFSIPICLNTTCLFTTRPVEERIMFQQSHKRLFFYGDPWAIMRLNSL